jgi:hypothetical protein
MVSADAHVTAALVVSTDAHVTDASMPSADTNFTVSLWSQRTTM